MELDSFRSWCADDSWPASSQGRRRLGATSDDECEVDISADLDRLKAQLEDSHAAEFAELEDKLTKKLEAAAKQTNALLKQLLNRTGV